MTHNDIHRAISERLLSLSQAYTLKIECYCYRGHEHYLDGFNISVHGSLLLKGIDLPTSISGYGQHADDQNQAMYEALESAYKDADPSIERRRR